MSVLKIVTYPAPILHQRSKPVERRDRELFGLIEDMMDTLDVVHGLGLAAIQVGVPLRVFIFDERSSDEKSGDERPKRGYSVLINPEIVYKEGEIKEEEGCLSIPDYRDVVQRAAVVRVKGFNKEGKPVELVGEGLLARVFQHEIDHLNGTLFIDRLSSLKRGLFVRRMKKVQRQSKVELSAKI